VYYLLQNATEYEKSILKNTMHLTLRKYRRLGLLVYVLSDYCITFLTAAVRSLNYAPLNALFPPHPPAKLLDLVLVDDVFEYGTSTTVHSSPGEILRGELKRWW